MKHYLLLLFSLFFAGKICVADETPRYDLRMRLQPGQTYAVRQHGENAGTMVFDGRKSRSSTTNDSTYEVRVLEYNANTSKISVTFGSQKTFGTSGSVTLYPPFSAIVEKPKTQNVTVDDIQGQSETVDIALDGRATWKLQEPTTPNRRYALKGKSPAERSRATLEWKMLGLKKNALYGLRFLIGARPLNLVRIGDSWRGRFYLEEFGTTQEVDVLYTLRAVENGIAVVATRTNSKKLDGNIAMSDMKEVDWTVTTGTLQIDLANGWTRREEWQSRSFQNLQFKKNSTSKPRNFLTTHSKSRVQTQTTPIVSVTPKVVAD